MDIAPELLQSYFLNEEQRAIVSHKTGPLLVIAGPGSGKTRSITLLAMNLLLCGNAQPAEIVLCTYTDKAAFEMQDRLASIAKEVNYKGDLSLLRVGTIHSICKQFVTEHLHHTPLGNNFETLDNFTQQLVLFEHIDTICTPGIRAHFQERWGSAWQIARKLQYFFDKIAEELIFDSLKETYPIPRGYPTTQETFLSCLTHAYVAYQKILAGTNRIDFAHLQKCAYNLLKDPTTFPHITKNIRYVLVDEYQDTNYIQEQILKLLASATPGHNFCVVGDEDQALYRFRGATVRNILEFTDKFPDCKKIYLTINYRSHPRIINFYNYWMNSIDWSNPTGTAFRTKKTIRKAPHRTYYKYPAVFTVQDVDAYKEAIQLAEIIHTLKVKGNIQDYSEVALLLHSVRAATSQPYRDALNQYGIPAYCPRARAYFLQTEVQIMVGCMVTLIGYDASQQTTSVENSALPEYIDDCELLLKQRYQQFPDLAREIKLIQQEIFQTEKEEETPGKTLADYFYRLIFTEAFTAFHNDEDQRQNLVIFSQLLKTFQSYYRHTTITQHNLPQLEKDLFHTFLCLLYEDGFNQYENPHKPFPKGHVQIMTIHQAKGLEFPVIVVGRLDKSLPRPDTEDKELQSFYHQSRFEPDNRIPAFDLRRLYYVAFSRAKSLLILTSKNKPQALFTDIWTNIPPWPTVHAELRRIALFSDDPKEHVSLKPRYSFTTHIQTYTTCPRQFQFFQEYNFQPAYTVDAFAGLLIHQTLERIHRLVLEKKLAMLDTATVTSIFERIFNFLTHTNLRSITNEQKERALQQVLNYFYYNYEDLQHVINTEMSIQVEHNHYVLTGKIDLLRRSPSGLEIIDFKTRTRPQEDSERLTLYKQQLYLYAYALGKRGELPRRLFIYWTAEANKKDALMELPFDREQIKQVSTYFDAVIENITHQNFDIVKPPAYTTCKVCDIRHLCKKEGKI